MNKKFDYPNPKYLAKAKSENLPNPSSVTSTSCVIEPHTHVALGNSQSNRLHRDGGNEIINVSLSQNSGETASTHVINPEVSIKESSAHLQYTSNSNGDPVREELDEIKTPMEFPCFYGDSETLNKNEHNILQYKQSVQIMEDSALNINTDNEEGDTDPTRCSSHYDCLAKKVDDSNALGYHQEQRQQKVLQPEHLPTRKSSTYMNSHQRYTNNKSEGLRTQNSTSDDYLAADSTDQVERCCSSLQSQSIKVASFDYEEAMSIPPLDLKEHECFPVGVTKSWQSNSSYDDPPSFRKRMEPTNRLLPENISSRISGKDPDRETQKYKSEIDEAINFNYEQAPMESRTCSSCYFVIHNQNENNAFQKEHHPQCTVEPPPYISTDNEEGQKDPEDSYSCCDCIAQNINDSCSFGYKQKQKQQLASQPEHFLSNNSSTSVFDDRTYEQRFDKKSRKAEDLRKHNKTSDDYLTDASCDFEEIISIPPLDLKNGEPLSDDSSNDDPPSCRISIGSFNNILPANVSWRHTSGGNCDLSPESQQYKANDASYDRVAQDINAVYLQSNHSCPPIKDARDYIDLRTQNHKFDEYLEADGDKLMKKRRSRSCTISLKKVTSDFEDTISIPPLDLKDQESLSDDLSMSWQSNSHSDDPPSCRISMEGPHRVSPGNESMCSSTKIRYDDPPSGRISMDGPHRVSQGNESICSSTKIRHDDPPSCRISLDFQNRVLPENVSYRHTSGGNCDPKLESQKHEAEIKPEETGSCYDRVAQNINAEYLQSNHGCPPIKDARDYIDLRTRNHKCDEYLEADGDKLMKKRRSRSCTISLKKVTSDFEDTVSIPPLDLKDQESLSDDLSMSWQSNSHSDDPPSCRISMEGPHRVSPGNESMCSSTKIRYDDPPSGRISMDGPHRVSPGNESICSSTKIRYDDPPSCRISLDFQNRVLPENVSYRHTSGGNCDPKLESQKHEAEIKPEETGSCYDCVAQNINAEYLQSNHSCPPIIDARDYKDLRTRNHKCDEYLEADGDKLMKKRRSRSCTISLKKVTSDFEDTISIPPLDLKDQESLSDDLSMSWQSNSHSDDPPSCRISMEGPHRVSPGNESMCSSTKIRYDDPPSCRISLDFQNRVLPENVSYRHTSGGNCDPKLESQKHEAEIKPEETGSCYDRVAQNINAEYLQSNHGCPPIIDARDYIDLRTRNHKCDEYLEADGDKLMKKRRSRSCTISLKKVTSDFEDTVSIPPLDLKDQESLSDDLSMSWQSNSHSDDPPSCRISMEGPHRVSPGNESMCSSTKIRHDDPPSCRISLDFQNRVLPENVSYRHTSGGNCDPKLESQKHEAEIKPEETGSCYDRVAQNINAEYLQSNHSCPPIIDARDYKDLRTRNHKCDEYLEADGDKLMKKRRSRSCTISLKKVTSDFEDTISIPPLDLKDHESLSDDLSMSWQSNSHSDDPPSCRISMEGPHRVSPGNESMCSSTKIRYDDPPSGRISMDGPHRVSPGNESICSSTKIRYDDPPSCRISLDFQNRVLPENVSYRHTSGGNCDPKLESQKHEAEIKPEETGSCYDRVAQNINAEYLQSNHSCPPIIDARDYKDLRTRNHKCDEYLEADGDKLMKKRRSRSCTISLKKVTSDFEDTISIPPLDLKDQESLSDDLSMSWQSNSHSDDPPSCRISMDGPHRVSPGNESMCSSTKICYDDPPSGRISMDGPHRVSQGNESICSSTMIRYDDPPSCRISLDFQNSVLPANVSYRHTSGDNCDPKLESQKHEAEIKPAETGSCYDCVAQNINAEYLQSNHSCPPIIDARDYKDLRTRNHKCDEYLEADGDKLMKKRRSRSCTISLKKVTSDFEDTISIPPLDLKDQESLSDDLSMSWQSNSHSDDPPSCRISMDGPHRVSQGNESICSSTKIRHDDPPSCRISLDFQNSVLPENVSYRHTSGGNCDPKLESQKHEAEIKPEETGSCYDRVAQNINAEYLQSNHSCPPIIDARDYKDLRTRNHKCDEYLEADGDKLMKKRRSRSCTISLKKVTSDFEDTISIPPLDLKDQESLSDDLSMSWQSNSHSDDPPSCRISMEGPHRVSPGNESMCSSTKIRYDDPPSGRISMDGPHRVSQGNESICSSTKIRHDDPPSCRISLDFQNSVLPENVSYRHTSGDNCDPKLESQKHEAEIKPEETGSGYDCVAQNINSEYFQSSHSCPPIIDARDYKDLRTRNHKCDEYLEADGDKLMKKRRSRTCTISLKKVTSDFEDTISIPPLDLKDQESLSDDLSMSWQSNSHSDDPPSCRISKDGPHRVSPGNESMCSSTKIRYDDPPSGRISMDGPHRVSQGNESICSSTKIRHDDPPSCRISLDFQNRVLPENVSYRHTSGGNCDPKLESQKHEAEIKPAETGSCYDCVAQNINAEYLQSNHSCPPIIDARDYKDLRTRNHKCDEYLEADGDKLMKKRRSRSCTISLKKVTSDFEDTISIPPLDLKDQESLSDDLSMSWQANSHSDDPPSCRISMDGPHRVSPGNESMCSSTKIRYDDPPSGRISMDGPHRVSQGNESICSSTKIRHDDPPSCRISLDFQNSVLPENVSYRHTSGDNCDPKLESQKHEAEIKPEETGSCYDRVAQNINAEYLQSNHSCPPIIDARDYKDLRTRNHKCDEYLEADGDKLMKKRRSRSCTISLKKVTSDFEDTISIPPLDLKDQESLSDGLSMSWQSNSHSDDPPSCRISMEGPHRVSPGNESMCSSTKIRYDDPPSGRISMDGPHRVSQGNESICSSTKIRHDDPPSCRISLDFQNSVLPENVSYRHTSGDNCDPKLESQKHEAEIKPEETGSCYDRVAQNINAEYLQSNHSCPPIIDARDYKDLRTRNHKCDEYLEADGDKLMKKRRSRSSTISLKKVTSDFEDTISIPPLDLKDQESLSDDLSMSWQSNSHSDDPPSCRISMDGPHRVSPGNESMCSSTKIRYDDPPSGRISMDGPHRVSQGNESICSSTKIRHDDPPSCRISLDFQNSVLPENVSYRHTSGDNCDPKLESQKHEAETKPEETVSCYDCIDQNIIEPTKQQQALDTVPDAQDYENLRAQDNKSDEFLAAVSPKKIESRLSSSCCITLQRENMNPTLTDNSSFLSLPLKTHQRLNDPPSCYESKNPSKRYLHENMSLDSPESDYMHPSCIDDQLTCPGLCHKDKQHPITSKQSGNLECYRDSIRDDDQFSCLKSSPDNANRNFVGEGTHFSESSDCGNNDSDPKITRVKPRDQTFTMQGCPANNEISNYEQPAEPNNELNQNESLCRQPLMGSDEKLGVEENCKLEIILSPVQLHKNSLAESSSKKMLQVDDDMADHDIYKDSSQTFSPPNKFCLENSAQGAFSTNQGQLPDTDPSMHRSAVLCSPRIIINYSDCDADKCKPVLLRCSSVNTLCEVWNQEADCKCCHIDLAALQFKTIDIVHAGRAGDSILPTSERRLAIKRTEYFHQVFSQLTRKQRVEETALRLRQMRFFQASFDSHYKKRLIENDCLTSQPNQAHSNLKIYTTKYKCPLSKTDKCMPVLNEQLLAHFLREHVNGMQRNEPSAIYKAAIILIEIRPLTFALGNNVCVSLMVYGGTMGCTDTLPIKRFMPVYNADLPPAYRLYMGYLPMMLMVCRTTLSAIGERRENEANDETVVALWVVSMNLPQPLRIMLTLYNRRLDVTRSAIMQTRSLSQSQDAHEFMSRSKHYMRLSELDIYMLSNAFRDGINIELSVREYNAMV